VVYAGVGARWPLIPDSRRFEPRSLPYITTVVSMNFGVDMNAMVLSKPEMECVNIRTSSPACACLRFELDNEADFSSCSDFCVFFFFAGLVGLICPGWKRSFGRS
jgi:hypothetical protein